MNMAKERYRVVVIPGDGIGPEVVGAALHVREPLSERFDLVRREAGLGYYKRTGRPYPEGFFEELRRADAVLKGPLPRPSAPAGTGASTSRYGRPSTSTRTSAPAGATPGSPRGCSTSWW